MQIDIKDWNYEVSTKNFYEDIVKVKKDVTDIGREMSFFIMWNKENNDKEFLATMRDNIYEMQNILSGCEDLINKIT